MRWMPSHTVCGPGGSARSGRFTSPPNRAISRTISARRGAFRGGDFWRTATHTDFHSDGSNTASQLRSGQLRPNRHTDTVRHAITSYTARQHVRRSTCSNRRPSTRQPDFGVRKNTSIIQRTQSYAIASRTWSAVPIGSVVTSNHSTATSSAGASISRTWTTLTAASGNRRSGRYGGRSVIAAVISAYPPHAAGMPAVGRSPKSERIWVSR